MSSVAKFDAQALIGQVPGLDRSADHSEVGGPPRHALAIFDIIPKSIRYAYELMK